MTTTTSFDRIRRTGIYFYRRTSFFEFALQILGLALSSLLIRQGRIEFRDFITLTTVLILWHGTVTLSHDLVDYSKDLVAHPNRPLSQGVLTPIEARLSQRDLFLILALIALFIKVRGDGPAAWALFFGILFVMGWSRLFYFRSGLAEIAFIRSISLHTTWGFAALFGIYLGQPDLLGLPDPFYFSLNLVGCFFLTEIARKTSIRARPLQHYYIHSYGKSGTLMITLVIGAIIFFTTYQLSLFKLLIPIEGLTLVAIIMAIYRPTFHRVSEGIAIASAWAHLWAITLDYYAKRFF